jgi:sulfonate transport system substrate-binding protein
MDRRRLLQLLATTPLIPSLRAAETALVVAVNQTTIESAPFFIQDIPGIRVVPEPNGRAASAELVAGRVDAATGSETQALLNSIAQPDLRIVLTLCECRYRVVARQSALIQRIADLRGKRVAHTPGTSSQYFLVDMLNAARLRVEDVTLVVLEGLDMPQALARGDIDAMAMWEPHAQNAIDLLGDDAVELADPAVYFERFNLNTTAAILDNPAKRAVMIDALRAIGQMSRTFEQAPSSYTARLAQAINTSESTISKVWKQFRFPANLDQAGLLDMMVKMEAWAAGLTQRGERSRETLAQLIDASVLAEENV